MNKYYENEAISQSKIKKIFGHPMSFKQSKPISGPSLTLGSLVDCLLLTKEEFESRFIVASNHNIPDTVASIWDEYFSSREELGNFDVDNINTTQLNNIAINNGYRKNQSEEIRLKYLNKGKEYYISKVKSKDKILITSEELDKAKSIVESLRTNEFTSGYLDKISDTQVEIYFSLKGFEDYPLKALLDWIEINKEEKTIRPWDLKTTSKPITSFRKEVFKYRLDLQASFYTTALKTNFPDYTILPFRFMVESTVYPGSPVIFECSDYLLQLGAFGGREDGETYLGFIDGLKLIDWHTKNNVWNYTKEQYENKGIITI